MLVSVDLRVQVSVLALRCTVEENYAVRVQRLNDTYHRHDTKLLFRSHVLAVRAYRSETSFVAFHITVLFKTRARVPM